ncbi:glycosyltransferase family 71 protein [Didymella exigua CBS 183.55]|uniref:Glycosyltransferase family 71 protein n=1 Tax=Didymella exigua CBS 183.55 TaxID=1150837 RepID=A0A6A5RN05_9PLEO|nr:glycosyltransferase family 71 protein [Didymella exigua CBS 183.55]KAF1928394.1 glycosyltransferase family 71 protein [Didymella exigua CBS 183.55]
MSCRHPSAVLRLIPIPIVLVIYCIFVQNRTHDGVTTSRVSQWVSTKTGISSSNLTALKSTFSHGIENFRTDLAMAPEDARPRTAHIEIKDGHPTSQETTFEPFAISKTPLSRLVNFTEEQEISVMRSHYLMRTSAKRLAPQLTFAKDAQGIVTTANAKYMPILLVSLRMLRRTGCQLPVKFVLTVTTSYQFKPFAILFSSFQHASFLDIDAFPAHNPTSPLITPPYTTHGLVLWPDLFGLKISEHYYHITCSPHEPPSARPSTESSNILLNKAIHCESLLMMVYYNYHGPDYYYPLFLQGSHGAGDEETFAQATIAGGEYRLSGLAQMDPRSDFVYRPPSKSHIHGNDQWDGFDELAEEPKPLFVHQNMDKLDPKKILDMNESTAKRKDGKYTRLWGEVKGIVEMFGYDVDRRMWKAVLEEYCRIDGVSETCASLRVYYTEVFLAVNGSDSLA